MPEPIEDIQRAIERFNRFRSPEAHAEFEAFDKKELIVLFSGAFCRTCGVLDYFEDLIIELDAEASIDLSVVNFENIDKATFRVRYDVTYRRPKCPGG